MDLFMAHSLSIPLPLLAKFYCALRPLNRDGSNCCDCKNAPTPPPQISRSPEVASQIATRFARNQATRKAFGHLCG